MSTPEYNSGEWGCDLELAGGGGLEIGRPSARHMWLPVSVKPRRIGTRKGKKNWNKESGLAVMSECR